MRRPRPTLTALLFLLMLGLIVPVQVDAYRLNDARAIGLGGELGGTPRGVHVVGYNPAYLGLQDNPRISFYTPVINVGFRISNDAYSISEMEEYFQDGKYLADSDKEDLLGEIGGDALKLRGDGHALIGGYSFPTEKVNIALTLDMIAVGDAELDKDLLRFALYGYPMDDVGVEKSFNDMMLEGVAFTRLGATFGKAFTEFEVLDQDWLDELGAGISFYYYQGIEYGTLEDFDARYVVGQDSAGNTLYMNGLVELLSPTMWSGSGVGLDLGVAAKVMNKRGIVGLSLLNLVGMVNWTNVERRVYGLTVDQAPPLDGMDNFDGWFDENFEPLDTLTSKDDLSQTLPREILLSGGYWLREDLFITGAYRQGLNRAAGATIVPRLAVGAEYKVHPMVPIRGGFGIGGRSGFQWGIGAGIRYKIWQSDIGIGWEKGIFNSATGFTFGISTSFFFDAPPADPFKTNDFWQREAEQTQ